MPLTLTPPLRQEGLCFPFSVRYTVLQKGGLAVEELCRRDRSRLWLRLGIRTLLTLACLLVFSLAGPALLSLFAPFVLAFLMAWLLNPAVRFFQRKLGGSRQLWSLVLLLTLLCLLGGLLLTLIFTLFSELRDLVENWQSIWTGFLSALDTTELWWERFFPYLPDEAIAWLNSLAEQFLTWLQTFIPNLLTSFASGAGAIAMKVPSFAVAAVVFVMGSYFIIADYPHIRYLAVRHLSPNTAGLLRFVKHTASAAFGGYIRAQFILSVGVFFILLAGFTLIGQKYAVLLALLLAVMDFIPIIGAGTAMLPWAVISFFTHDVRPAVELLVIWGIIALFRRLGEPKVVGNQTGLSPILSLLSIYMGMRLGGVAGMILGPVVFLVIINICKAGVFDSTLADLRLAAGDIRAILKNKS